MSSSTSHIFSFSQFQDLVDAALRQYSQKTGKDIVTDPLTARLLPCHSSDAVLNILQEQAHAFNQYRNGDWKIQLMRCLGTWERIEYLKIDVGRDAVSRLGTCEVGMWLCMHEFAR